MNKRKLADSGTNDCSLKRAKIPEKGLLDKNVIRYYWTPSLEHFSAAKIIITLWSGEDIQRQIKTIFARRSIDCQVCKKFVRLSYLSDWFQDVKNKIYNRVLEVSEFDVIRKILADLVEPVGQEILDWIEYQDKNVFYVSHCQYKNVAVNYLDCIVWTSRGIIDYEQSAKAILAKGGLHDVEKYHLACSYCFEDDMAIIIPNILHKVRYSISENFYDQKDMIYFWSAHLTRDFTKLNEQVSCFNKKCNVTYSINEYMFWILASKHGNNQVAIKFMWNRLSDVEKSTQIKSVVRYSKTDLKCFFLSQMNEDEQQRIFTSDSKNMLLCLLDDWLWKDYFLPTMHYVLDMISALDFLSVVEDIVKNRMVKHFERVVEYNRYKTILKVMWQSASIDLKDYIFELENGIRCSGIIFSLLHEKNIDVIQLILRDMSEEQKKTVVFSSKDNFTKCYCLIIDDQIDVVKYLIDNTLYTDRYIDMFKRMLVESHGHSYGHDIAVHFGRNREYDKLDKFIEFVFKIWDNERQFKENLAHSEITEHILDTIVADDDEDSFALLETFFKWCTNDIQKDCRFKREMYEVHFTKVICKFVEKERYELLTQFFDWCFSDNERKVRLVKHTYYENHDKIQLMQLVKKLVIKPDNLESLKNFTSWCFVEKRKIARFKKWILEHDSEDTVGVCVELLCDGMFDLADEYIKWCCDASETKTNKIKKELMFCVNARRLFLRHKKDLRKVMNWLNPSGKALTQFKRRFVDFDWLKDYDIAVLLIRNGKWSEVDEYIELTFTSDSDRKEFKEKLAYSEFTDDNLNYILANNECGFENLGRFFSWCASENAERVVELKGEMYLKYFTTVICKLIEEDKYQLLGHFMNWCYRREKQRVELLKLCFCGYYKYTEVVQLVLNLVEKSDELQSFKKFVLWCFTSNEEITAFKKFILEPGTGDTVGVCVKLLEKKMFKLAEEFVCWCCDSSQIKVDMFKNKLLLYGDIKNIFNRYKYEKNVLKKIIEWFNPSLDVQIQFRRYFKDLWWVPINLLKY